MEAVVGHYPLNDLRHLLQCRGVEGGHPAVRDPVPTGYLQSLQVLLCATGLQLFKMKRKKGWSSICSVGMLCNNANIYFFFYEKQNKTSSKVIVIFTLSLKHT